MPISLIAAVFAAATPYIADAHRCHSLLFFHFTLCLCCRRCYAVADATFTLYAADDISRYFVIAAPPFTPDAFATLMFTFFSDYYYYDAFIAYHYDVARCALAADAAMRHAPCCKMMRRVLRVYAAQRAPFSHVTFARHTFIAFFTMNH